MQASVRRVLCSNSGEVFARRVALAGGRGRPVSGELLWFGVGGGLCKVRCFGWRSGKAFNRWRPLQGTLLLLEIGAGLCTVRCFGLKSVEAFARRVALASNRGRPAQYASPSTGAQTREVRTAAPPAALFISPQAPHHLLQGLPFLGPGGRQRGAGGRVEVANLVSTQGPCNQACPMHTIDGEPPT